MEDNIPNNVFVDAVHENQMDSIVVFRDELRARHPDVFKSEEDFIAVKFDGPDLSIFEQPIRFNVIYSDSIPEPIRKEFDAYLKKYLAQ